MSSCEQSLATTLVHWPPAETLQTNVVWGVVLLQSCLLESESGRPLSVGVHSQTKAQNTR